MKRDKRMPGSVRLTLLAVLEMAREQAVRECSGKSLNEVQKMYDDKINYYREALEYVRDLE